VCLCVSASAREFMLAKEEGGFKKGEQVGGATL